MKSQTKKMVWTSFFIVSIFFSVFSYFYLHKTTKPTLQTKTILSFLGAPGSGKGTLAAHCAKNLGFINVSTGNLCRTEIASGSKKGKIIQQYSITNGLTPDKIITEMVEDWLNKQTSTTPIILDGYPRTPAQARIFATLLKNKFSDYHLHVIYLKVSDYEEIIQRISTRLICENKDCQAVYNRALLKDPTHLICDKCGSKLIQREDDAEEVVRKRLETFAANNDQIITFYESIGIPVETFNVSHKTAEQIFEEFKQLLK